LSGYTYAHLQQPTLQMFYMRFAHALESMALDQFDNPIKARPHILWESLDLIQLQRSNAIRP
jgi:hypothetical protein